MKKISKRPNKQLQKHFVIKKVVFEGFQTISQEGHFVKPSSQASFANQKIHIISKGYGKHAVQLANQVLSMLKQPMLTLVDENSKLNKLSQEVVGNDLTQEAKQRYFVLNLIDSCLQELADKDYEGSCSFGICYILSNTLFIVKNKMIEFYMISHKQKEQYEFKTIASKKLPFVLNSISTDQNSKNVAVRETNGFLNCDKNYQNIISKKYFPQVSFVCMKIPKNKNLIFLMGNSECFCNFSEEEVILLFQEGGNLRQGGLQLIKSSKKKWKTIYQEDMTLIVSRFS